MLCVPNVDFLRNRILQEAHGSRYSIYPGSTKMYHVLREIFWCEDLKNDIAEFVVKCPNCPSESLKLEWLTKKNPSSHLKVGRYQYGFCGRFSLVSKAI